jgi:LysR family transcriptional activator of mexEF-oprN operon
LGDKLFVWVGHRLKPTPRAFALHDEITPALDIIEEALRITKQFNATTEERVFQVGVSDDVQLCFLTAISKIVE